MAAVGFGGAFVRVQDPEALYRWYEQHLGLSRTNGYLEFPVAEQRAQIVLTFVDEHDDSFPARQAAALNLQVDDLDGLLDRMAAEGVAVDPERPAYDFGRFGAFTDPEGNRVEVWQPIPEG